MASFFFNHLFVIGGLQSNTSQISNAFLCKFQYHSTISLVTLNVSAWRVHYRVCPMGPTISTRSKHLCQLPLPKLKFFFHSLNPKKSPGPDMISSFGLKMVQQQISTQLQWIPSVLRKTLFDFIKSCGSQISLKFSEVALLGLLYSPK